MACARLVQLDAWPARVRATGAVALVACGWVAASLLPDAYAVSLATLPGFVALIGALGHSQAAPGTTSTLAGWLSRPTLVRLGEWSFAFYLVHILVMRTLEHTVVSHPALALAPGLALMGGVLLVSVVLAGTLHHLVEVPANAWIRARTQPRIGPRILNAGQLEQ